MTRFLGWRKTTWGLLVWGAAMATWQAVGGPGFVLVGLLWLAGVVTLSLVWFLTRSPFRQGRGFRDGLFVWPGRGHWRVLNLHRVF
ncbi:MAG TPA: hypothetical protein VLB86_06910 [Gaiellaceae bacterium]|nr:hypothetical protein [Gaiellaceae bacterium]